MKLAVLDISENGRQIGEKLFALLDESQQKAWTQYVRDRKNKRTDTSAPVRIVPKYQRPQNIEALPERLFVSEKSKQPLSFCSLEYIYFYSLRSPRICLHTPMIIFEYLKSQMSKHKNDLCQYLRRTCLL